jgi:hypothetical protein
MSVNQRIHGLRFKELLKSSFLVHCPQKQAGLFWNQKVFYCWIPLNKDQAHLPLGTGINYLTPLISSGKKLFLRVFFIFFMALCATSVSQRFQRRPKKHKASL